MGRASSTPFGSNRPAARIAAKLPHVPPELKSNVPSGNQPSRSNVPSSMWPVQSTAREPGGLGPANRLFSITKWWLVADVWRLSANAGLTNVLWRTSMPLGSSGGVVPRAWNFSCSLATFTTTFRIA